MNFSIHLHSCFRCKIPTAISHASNQKLHQIERKMHTNTVKKKLYSIECSWKNDCEAKLVQGNKSVCITSYLQFGIIELLHNIHAHVVIQSIWHTHQRAARNT